MNKRALAVYDYLARAHPDWEDESIARSMGYTVAAIQRIREAELSQEDGFEEDMEDAGEDGTGGGTGPADGFDFS